MGSNAMPLPSAAFCFQIGMSVKKGGQDAHLKKLREYSVAN